MAYRFLTPTRIRTHGMDPWDNDPAFRGKHVPIDKENRAYSVRLSGSDLRKLKIISARLMVTESDVIRFALRQTLNRLAPLDDETSTGAALLPVFVDFGDELTAYFDLDANRLDEIFNASEREPTIDREDIALLLLLGLEPTRLYARLREVTDRYVEPDTVMDEFRNYLYEKYLYRTSA